MASSFSSVISQGITTFGVARRIRPRTFQLEVGPPARLLFSPFLTALRVVGDAGPDARIATRGSLCPLAKSTQRAPCLLIQFWGFRV